MSKERLTIALCASAMGEMTPLVIGKSVKPRCFKNIEPKTLPLTYLSNQKAWMTSYTVRRQKYSTTSLLCIRILRCNWHNINNISMNQNQLEQDEPLSVCSGIHTVF